MMDVRRLVPAGAQAVGYSASNATVSACLVVESPLQHSKDDIVVACDEPFDLSPLRIIEGRHINFPLVACAARQIVKDGIHAGIENAVNVDYKIAEIWQPYGPRNACTANEENLTTRVGKQ
ncbi:hypothetical protein RFN29_14020 [Mesorhizobium sp. VK22B]|uniref:Uncharacterized protein n=1 Tax=Mesorhizobium captivum TaxID=3072319 RepID=A0ABU4Z0G2_9HYPH|nr:hypothetical protein [Mesorhizobium sp. VK22B]MDX8492692.1 hypothetical protein [Mesorhizobium sp. VK22B]